MINCVVVNLTVVTTIVTLIGDGLGVSLWVRFRIHGKLRAPLGMRKVGAEFFLICYVVLTILILFVIKFLAGTVDKRNSFIVFVITLVINTLISIFLHILFVGLSVRHGFGGFEGGVFIVSGGSLLRDLWGRELVGVTTTRTCYVLSAMNSTVLAGSNSVSIICLVRLPRTCSLSATSLRRERGRFFETFRCIHGNFVRGRSVFLHQGFGSSCIVRNSACVRGTRHECFRNERCLRRFYVLSFALSSLSDLRGTCRTGPLSCHRGLAGTSGSELSRFLRTIRDTISVVHGVENARVEPLDITRVGRRIFHFIGKFRSSRNLESVRYTSVVHVKRGGNIFFSIYSRHCLPSHVGACIASDALRRTGDDLCVSVLRELNIRLPYSRIVGRV